MPIVDFERGRLFDLTQPIEDHVPYWPTHPPTHVGYHSSIATGGRANVEKIAFCAHSGTHVDAPNHFFDNLPTVDELDLDSLIGPAVRLDLSHLPERHVITPDDLAEAASVPGAGIARGDLVLLHTGHSRHWRAQPADNPYMTKDWPRLGLAAVDELIRREVRAVGIDALSPDGRDPSGTGDEFMPCHYRFLPRGILILENLCGLEAVPVPRFTFVALPLRLRHGSGAPMRALAAV